MKTLLLLLLGTSSCAILAQDTITKFYHNGLISLIEINSKNNPKHSTIKVINQKGDTVFHENKKTNHGNFEFDLTFHKNGGIATIQAKKQLENGTELFAEKYTLDSLGNLNNYEINCYNRKIAFKANNTEKPFIQEVAVCATPVSSTLVIYNKKKKSIYIKIMKLSGQNINEIIEKKLMPNDSIITKEYINADIFLEPKNLFQIAIKNNKKSNYTPLNLLHLPTLLIEENRQKRLYKYYITN